MKVIMCRERREVNTDPQRRCYNGAYFSSEVRWSNWSVLEYTTPEKVARRLEFWRELNDYAVSHRGESARRELKIGDDE